MFRLTYPRTGAAFLCALVIALPGLAGAQTVAEAEREEDYVRVVQPQDFTRGGRFQMAPLFALSMNDPLVQTFTVGANMTFFARDWIGITFGGQYAFDARRSAQNALLAQQVRPETNPLKWIAGLGVEFVPIYGKFAVLNRGIMHWDVFISVGIGGQGTARGEDTFIGHFTGFVGAGWRLFLTSWMSLNIEFRDWLYVEKFVASDGSRQLSNFVNNLFFSAGIGFFLGGGSARR